MRSILSPRRVATFASLFLGLSATAAFADDAVRNTVERVQDRRDLRHDGAVLVDDHADKLQIELLREEFSAARTRLDAPALAALDARVESYLAFELGESDQEIVGAKRELGRDRRELRSDHREIRKNRRQVVAPGERADDRRDLRDDRRDRREDRRDVAHEKHEERTLEETRADWIAFPDDAANAEALSGKAAILDRLVAVAQAEVARDKQEVREGRRELREDRRETREDRREG